MSNYPAGVPAPRTIDVEVRCINDDCPTAMAARTKCDECGGARVAMGPAGLEPCSVCDGNGYLLDDDDRETYWGRAVVDLGATWPQGDAEECRVCGGEVVLL